MLEHSSGILPSWVAEHGATIILAEWVGGKAQQLFGQQSIKVIAGCPSKNPAKIGVNGCEHNHYSGH